MHKNPAKLSMVITELDIGGAEKAFVRIACGLKQKNWDIRVVSLRDKGPLTAALENEGLPVTALHCGVAFNQRAIYRLYRVLAADRPHAILSFLHQANLVSRLAGSLAGVSCAVSGVRVADRRLAVAISERLTRPCTDHYIAVSQAVRNVHQALCGISPNRISVIRNGVDFTAIDGYPPVSRGSLNLHPEDFVILCAGRLTPQKSPQHVLAAFIELHARQSKFGQPVKLVFTGDGPLLEELQQRVHAAGLQDFVLFTGWRADLIGIMKAANVLVLASQWEGLPNVLIEAQTAGLPVISSRADGCAEIVSHGVTGQLFTHGNLTELVSLLTEQIHNPTHASLMASTARESVRTLFSWQHCIDQYDTLMRRLIIK